MRCPAGFNCNWSLGRFRRRWWRQGTRSRKCGRTWWSGCPRISLLSYSHPSSCCCSSPFSSWWREKYVNCFDQSETQFWYLIENWFDLFQRSLPRLRRRSKRVRKMRRRKSRNVRTDPVAIARMRRPKRRWIVYKSFQHGGGNSCSLISYHEQTQAWSHMGVNGNSGDMHIITREYKFRSKRELTLIIML